MDEPTETRDPAPIYVRTTQEERDRAEFIAQKYGLRKVAEVVRMLIKQESDRLGYQPQQTEEAGK